ncbi:MAG: glycosyltransferase family 4 protein [Bacteroidota bacterium]
MYEIISRLCNKIDFEVITQKDTNINQKLLDLSIPVRIWKEYDDNFRALRWLTIIIWNLKTIWYTYNDKASCFHINDLKGLARMGFALAIMKKRFVFNARDTNVKSKPYRGPWKLLQYSDAIICLSKEMVQDYVERLPIRRVTSLSFDYAYSLIDFDYFRPVNFSTSHKLRQIFGWKEGEKVILVVGKIDPKKNQLNLVKEWSKKPISNARLVLIGDYAPKSNGYNKAVGDFVHEERLNSVSILGYKKNIYEYYQAADLVLICSKREGLARCMIEGLACGRAVVSFNVCSASEILENNRCGTVVRQGNFHHLLKEAGQLLSDKKRIKEYEENAVQTSRSLFKEERILKTYYEVWKKEEK